MQDFLSPSEPRASHELPIRVVVVEDSPTARALLVAILESDPRLRVVGEAKNGAEAVALAERLRPDVITMDLHMPQIGGLDAIRRIMCQTPTPIVVVSESVGPEDTAASVRALGAGALAALPRPSGPQAPDFEERSRELTSTVKSMSEVKVVRRRQAAQNRPPATAPSQDVRILTVAASTGGPAALHRIFSQLPRGFPVPILVVQHIAQGFLKGLVEWWASGSALSVKIAASDQLVEAGTIYVAPDHGHMGIGAPGAIAISSQAPIGGHRPSGSYLFESAARAYGPGVVGLILTGMGSDGVEGLREVKARGGYVMAQDEATSVVFGMPGAAVRAGLVDALLAEEAIAQHLQSFFQRVEKLESTW